MKRSILTAVALCLGVFAIAQEFPWPMRYSTPQRTSQSPARGALVGELAWTYAVPGNVPQFASNNSQIILGPTYNGNWWSEELYLSALSPAGIAVWRKKTVPYVWGASQGVGGSPALDAEGNIITPAGQGLLIKYSPTLAELWRKEGNFATTNDASPAVLPDGSVRHVQAGTLRAIAADGTTLFTTGGAAGHVTVAQNGDMAVSFGPIGHGGHTLNEHNVPAVRYFNADGSIRWTLLAYHGGNRQTMVFGPDNTLYNGGTAYNPADGSVKWSDPAPIGAAAALGKNGQLYVSGSSQIRAYNKDTGAILWTVALPGDNVDRVAIDSRDVLYATTANGYFVSISPSGSILWQLKVTDKFDTAPIVAAGDLIVAEGYKGFDHFVYAAR